MADDIYLSPEEQDERARKWLKDNGPSLIIGIALGLAGIYGFDYYKAAEKSKAEQASAVYETVIEEIQDSQLSDITNQVEDLKSNYADTSYAAKASLISTMSASRGLSPVRSWRSRIANAGPSPMCLGSHPL